MNGFKLISMSTERLTELRTDANGQITEILRFPDSGPELINSLRSLSAAHPEFAKCERSDHPLLPKQMIDSLLFRADNYRFYFGPVPGYQCDPCEKTYLHRDVFQRICFAVHREVVTLKLPCRVKNLQEVLDQQAVSVVG